MEKLGNAIRRYRERAVPPISQRVLGEIALNKTGVAAQSIISRIESGSQKPKVNQLKKICDVINAPYEELLGLLSQEVVGGEVVSIAQPQTPANQKVNPWEIIRNLSKAVDDLTQRVEEMENEKQRLCKKAH